MAVSSQFSIKDLEEFSGVKAHTIRMWERRYELLSPGRSESGIRHYGTDDLKAILNVAYLNNNGLKISKIAALSKNERNQRVTDLALTRNDPNDALSSMKLALLGFDEVLFESVSSKFRDRRGFEALVMELYLPLLELVGLLWQTDAICPAHEHFVSNLVRQKLIAETDQLPLAGQRENTVHVLYLPEEEIHELGLLFVNYHLRSRGKRTIYLGQSVPLNDLARVAEQFPEQLVFVSPLTSYPPSEAIPDLLVRMRAALPQERVKVLVCGAHASRVPKANWPANVQVFPNIRDLRAALDEEHYR
jgi:MerR family transcriptional regulator, light-induced transcriptional regulator